VAGASVVKKAALVLSFLALVMVGIALLCWRLIHKVAERENAARHDAMHDALTGLPNRSALHMEIDRLSKVESGAVAIAFADLDGFKDVNDTYDHETGDRLIRAVAAGLSCLMAGKGDVFRLGGDEFVILLHGHGAETRANTIADTMIAFLSKPFDIDGRMATVGASIGIASVPAGRLASRELMRRADVAMYRAKDAGKNRYYVYDPQFDGDRDRDLRIASDLRTILDEGRLAIAYQPIVDAHSRKAVAIEALARWPVTPGPAVAPDKFIAVAEAHGLIDQLGEAILVKACADLRQWPDVRLSVNVSPVQLRNPNFVKRTLETITAHGLDYSRVELEITESVLVQDIPGARAIFQKLREAGLHIALDDFGTGFSSINYLRQFNFDRIKIDKSLIGKVLSGGTEQNIVHGTMLMANGLAAGVTAEGVEYEEQVNLLRLCGCDEMQGYLFSRPKSAEEISRMFEPEAGPLAASPQQAG
jgi:diguanylate cyclase (GGDEF)-like protein